MDELLQFVLDAHGGLDRWLSVQRLDARMSLTGYLFNLKHHPCELRDICVQVQARRPRATLVPFLLPHQRGHFDGETVSIQTDDGTIISRLDAPRNSFEAHQRVTPWSELQLLYFAGYLAWNQLTLPFLLASAAVQCREIGQYSSGGDPWRVLEVIFPDAIPTHSSEQRFFFDADGMLRRQDFVTEIAPAKATLLCFDTREFDGFFFPTRSRMVARAPNGEAAINGPSSVWIELDSLTVSRD